MWRQGPRLPIGEVPGQPGTHRIGGTTGQPDPGRSEEVRPLATNPWLRGRRRAVGSGRPLSRRPGRVRCRSSSKAALMQFARLSPSKSRQLPPLRPAGPDSAGSTLTFRVPCRKQEPFIYRPPQPSLGFPRLEQRSTLNATPSKPNLLASETFITFQLFNR